MVGVEGAGRGEEHEVVVSGRSTRLWWYLFLFVEKGKKGEDVQCFLEAGVAEDAGGGVAGAAGGGSASWVSGLAWQPPMELGRIWIALVAVGR